MTESADRADAKDVAGKLHVPPGHPYSPIPSPDDVERALRRANTTGLELPGIELRAAEQLALLTDWLPAYRELDLPDQESTGRYWYDNPYFTYGDAIGYALMLRHLRPGLVIEVGTGFSSALALDINERYLGGETSFTFIDPDPERLSGLVSPTDLAGCLRAEPVQDVPLEVFDELGSGDILFIDSSHVLRAGSDVQFLFDDVLPRLRSGVHIHIHDVFWPFEYPSRWLRTGVAVNEAYAVRLLLQHCRAYRIVLFNSYLETAHRPWLAQNMPLMLAGRYETGGLWIERV